MRQKSEIDERLSRFIHLKSQLKDQSDYFELALVENDLVILGEIELTLKSLAEVAKNFEIECLFSELNDTNNCFLDINAGAGGTDSCDFASMLLRMYERFANDRGFKTEIVSLLEGEEA
jgi:peptide chain release factor 2